MTSSQKKFFFRTDHLQQPLAAVAEEYLILGRLPLEHEEHADTHLQCLHLLGDFGIAAVPKLGWRSDEKASCSSLLLGQ